MSDSSWSCSCLTGTSLSRSGPLCGGRPRGFGRGLARPEAGREVFEARLRGDRGEVVDGIPGDWPVVGLLLSDLPTRPWKTRARTFMMMDIA